MLKLIQNDLTANTQIENSLLDLLNPGFISVNECFFLKKLFEQQSYISQADFIDKTGYECFINSIHIDDYTEGDFLPQALLFLESLVKEWEKLQVDKPLEVILSKTDFGFNIKFHVARPNEIWINTKNLDNFEEAIMIYKVGI